MRRRWLLLALLLIAALTPVVIFGSGKLRISPSSLDVVADPAPPTPSPAPVEHRLAPLTSSIEVAPVRNAEKEEEPPPAPSASSRTDAPGEPRGYVASAGAGLKSALSIVMGAPEPGPDTAPSPSRQPEPTAGFGSSAPLAGSSLASATGEPSGPLAMIQFIGLTQDQQVLERYDFEAQALREVKINVWWDLAGAQTQRLELFAPDGALYRRVSASFDANALPRTQGRVLVQTPLPVGGTWITEYSLFGTWRVDVYLGGQTSPVTSASFVLNP